MRRLSLTAAAIVSTAVLLTTTSVMAISPAKVNMGSLKPQGSWKVGTVDQGSERYCAMVGTYNNNVVAAFARNPQGLGSLALDFGDAMFTPGKSYDVSLTAEGMSSRSFKGRASTERSLVVQIGQDGSFYDALSKNGTLGVDMSSATLRLDLAKFSDSHKDLVACAGQLSTDEQSAEPKQRTAELPIDRELAELSQARTKLADASTKADDIKKTMESKASSLDALEAQLEEEARAEIERSKTNLASIDTKQNDVREKLAAKGVETKSRSALDLSMVEPAAGAPDLPVPSRTTASGGRTLLAAIGGKEGLEVPPSTGSSSRDIESRELGLADANRAAAETAKALELKNEIAAIEAEKNAQAQKTLAAFDARQQELDTQTTKLSEKRDNSLAKLSAAAAAEDNSKKLRADVIAQQAKIAEVSETKQKEVQALPRQLAATNTEFESRIAALEAERNQLRDQVNSVVAENERLKQSAGQGKPEDRLEIAQLKKQMLDMETQRQAEVARATAAQKELDDARQQIASLRQGSKDEMARLSNLQRTLESERAQLSSERGAVAAERTAIAKEVSETAGKERADIENLRLALEKKQADLEAVAIEQGAEATRLQQEKDGLETVKASVEQDKASIAKDKSDVAVLASSQKLVETERAELNTLRDRIKTLETDLVKAREQAAVASAAVAAAPKPVVDTMAQAEKAELSRLKNENETLRQRLSNLLSSDKPEKTAEAVKPEVLTPVAVTQDIKAEVAPAVTTAAVETKVEEKTAEVKTPVQTDVAPVKVAEQEAVPVDLTPTPAVAANAGSPVLASLLGKRVPAVEPVTTPVEQKWVDTRTVEPKQAPQKIASLTAQELNASEPAAGTPELSPLPGNDKRMPAVPAAKVEQEVVAPVVKITKTEETKIEEVKTAQDVPAVEPAVKPVAAAASTDAEVEIARMAPITASVPLNETTRDVPVQKVTMRREKPAVQEDPAQDKGVFGIFGRALGYNAAAEHAKAAKDVETTRVAAVAEPQIPQDTIIRVTRPTEPVAAPQPAAGSEITTADGNRAAAFLDNIMAFHRPDGSDATGTAVASRARAVAPQKPVADTSRLNAIETAAGGPAMAAPVAAAVAAPVQQPVAARVAPAGASLIALDQLLRQAGLGNVTIVNGATGVAQWSTGALNGMYESQTAQGGFDQQTDAYLARYQDDCPGKLQVSKGGVQPTPSGSVRVVDISCSMPDNSYATSVVFTQAQGGFAALLHAGQASARSDVKQVGDKIAAVLRTAGGVSLARTTSPSVVPASYAQQPVAAAQTTERPRFRVEIQAPSTAPEGVYDLPTTIIE